MLIKAVNFYKYNGKFKSPILTPKTNMTHRKVLIVAFVTDDNQSFYGECNAFDTNWYDKETISSVKATLEKWAKQILNKRFNTFEEWQPYLDLLNKQPSARSTVVMAVYQMYHDLPSFEVNYGATISGLTSQQLDNLKNTKPQRIKLKWSDHLINDISLLNRQLKHDYKLALDANESLDMSDFENIKDIDKQAILYIEEPFKELANIDKLEIHTYPAIAIDEKATDEASILSIIERFPIKVVVIKPFRIGGIDNARSLIKKLKAQNIKIVIGGMYEYGLSRYFTALLAKLGDYPGDITPEGYYFEEDFTQGIGQLKEGMISFSPPKIDKSKLFDFD